MAVLGSKTQSVINELVFNTTTTWACPFDCRAIVTVIGAGGGGGAGRNDSGGYSVVAAGGGAGGVAKSILTLASGTSYVATCGAAGSSGATSGDGAVNGGNGGASTFGVSGASVLLTGNGGNGGTAAQGTSTNSATGGSGGTASGGNIFSATGGEGGDAACTAFDSNGGHHAAGGGGAAAILGIGYRGGDALNSTTGYSKLACGGGAGVGGEGGDATCTGGTSQTNVTAFGGSMFGKGVSKSQATSSNSFAGGQFGNEYKNDYKFRGFTSGSVEPYYTSVFYRGSLQSETPNGSIFDGLTGACAHIGLDGYYTQSAGPGAGSSGGYAGYTSGQTNTYHTPGLFGGGGGAALSATSGACYGSAGSVGAGGGGAVTRSTTDCIGGMGGVGMVVISILEYL